MVPENLAQPLYLGKGVGTSSYFFLANKSGIGRFIKFVKYPFWCGHKDLPDELVLNSTLPESVLNEVTLFINGLVEFEITPKRQGRAESVSRKEVINLTPVPGELNVSNSPTISSATELQKSSLRGVKTSGGSEVSRISEPVGKRSTVVPSSKTIDRLPTEQNTRTPGPATCGTGQRLGQSDDLVRGSDSSRQSESGTGSSGFSSEPGDGRSGRRPKPGSRVLGEVGTTPVGVRTSPVANDDGIGLVVKSKRKRRTKAEMEEARSLLNQSQIKEV